MKRLINHKCTEPDFNMACEEYFLRYNNDETIILWQNSPAVIIGRNQNAYAEVDLNYAKQNGIEVIRRLSGGGAVFHDLGNVCFSSFINGKEYFNDFTHFLRPVTEYLRSLGVAAEFSGRNDLIVDGMKISGNAQASHKNRVMHHGTLLFDTEMDMLSGVLTPNPLKLKSHAVSSVKSRVTNLCHYLDMDVEQFKRGLAKWFFVNEGYEYSILTPYELNKIEEIRCEKYAQDSWNIGNNPAFNFENSEQLETGMFTINCNIDSNNKITGIDIYADFIEYIDTSWLKEHLIGVEYSRNAVARAMSDCDISYIIPDCTPEQFLNTMFP